MKTTCTDIDLLDVFKKCWNEDVKAALDRPGAINSEYDLQCIIFSAYWIKFKTSDTYLVQANCVTSTEKPDLIICKKVDHLHYEAELICEFKVTKKGPTYIKDIHKFIKYDERHIISNLNDYNYSSRKIEVIKSDRCKYIFASLSEDAKAGSKDAFKHLSINDHDLATRIKASSLKDRIYIASWDYRNKNSPIHLIKLTDLVGAD
jgi:hypothetical protein